MIKLIVFAVLLYIIYRLAVRLIQQPKMMPRTDAAKLLGVAADADSDSVIEAHRRLIGKVHPDVGGSAELAARINEARDTLLRP